MTTAAPFKDHFSDNSAYYGRYRPHYPRELFRYLASVSPGNDIAWDCACGTGQAALGLSEFFTKVAATDASGNQIAKAVPCPRITYAVSPAESSSFADAALDLITVAQALHWFEAEAFFREANRVLKANGILAVWTYNLLRINDEIDRVLEKLYSETLGPYWPQERKMVENSYRGMAFPFSPVIPPAFSMREEWSLHHLLGYLTTWSATQKYRKSNSDPKELSAIFADITARWGNPEGRKTVIWPLTVIIRKKG
jgi:SAM-dependent methyltransferase